jgi:nitronate monooxygenase
VAREGLLGTVSGTGLDSIMARRLQLGDPGGEVRRALEAFPCPETAARILEEFFIAGGKDPECPFRTARVLGGESTGDRHDLLVVSNFVEVYLAKEGHEGLVGINYLEKIQTPTLPSLYGAMLADVDVVAVGAGIPREIPGVLDRLAKHEPVDLDIHVLGEVSGGPHKLRFDPAEVLKSPAGDLKRPMFFPIVASVTLANMLVKKATSTIEGLVIEGHTAGGHNATPRGRMQLSDAGEPVYGRRDEVDLQAIRELGLPFWIAGSCGSPEDLARARDAGAVGIQVGTLFALCEESGLTSEIKHRIMEMSGEGGLRVFTDPVASPTGFPFKVLSLPDSNSESAAYDARGRVCDLGYLREAYELPDGTLGWRCPAEAAKEYVRKGGRAEDAVGRKCLCNGLLANIGLEQVRGGGNMELPLVTFGVDTSKISGILQNGRKLYTAAEVANYLLS